jgi:arginyl-tRNA synthetase
MHEAVAIAEQINHVIEEKLALRIMDRQFAHRLAKPLGQPPRAIAQAIVAQLASEPAFAQLCLEPVHTAAQALEVLEDLYGLENQ